MGTQTTFSTIKNSFLNSPFLIIYLTIIVIVGFSSIQSDETIFFLASESSPIQSLSAIGYFAAFAMAIFLHVKGQISFGPGAAIIFLSMGLREMDFHDRFTTMGIMKTRFYISDAVPLAEKIPAAIIMLSLGYIITVFLIKHFRPFLIALRATNKAALLTLNGIAFTVISKLIDSQPHLLFCITEETIELAIPCFFILSLLLCNKTEKTI